MPSRHVVSGSEWSASCFGRSGGIPCDSPSSCAVCSHNACNSFKGCSRLLD